MFGQDEDIGIRSMAMFILSINFEIGKVALNVFFMMEGLLGGCGSGSFGERTAMSAEPFISIISASQESTDFESL